MRGRVFRHSLIGHGLNAKPQRRQAAKNLSLATLRVCYVEWSTWNRDRLRGVNLYNTIESARGCNPMAKIRTLIAIILGLVASALPVLYFPERLQAHILTTSVPQKSSQRTGDVADKAYTPEAGSRERREIMDALRGDHAAVVFKVHYLKVHGNWAFVDVTPIDGAGKPVAEGGASLIHKLFDKWTVIDLSILPEDPDNPMGADDPTPKFVKAVQKAFPGVPSDIFPPRARPK